MASSKEYLDFILEQLSELDDVSYRAMRRRGAGRFRQAEIYDLFMNSS